MNSHNKNFTTRSDNNPFFNRTKRAQTSGPFLLYKHDSLYVTTKVFMDLCNTRSITIADHNQRQII